MKVRRRSVNIFNMSLLDILCGALGAFCFMMLTLFPSYIAAKSSGAYYGKDIERDWQEIESEAGSFVVMARWESAHDVDLYIKHPSGDVRGPKRRGTMTAEHVIVRDATRGPAYETYEAIGGDERGEVTIYLRAKAGPGASGPATVRLCVFRRIRLLERAQTYGWAPAPVTVPLDTDVPVGSFSVDPDATTISLQTTTAALF